MKHEHLTFRKSNTAAKAGPEPRQQNQPVPAAEPTDAELWKDRGNKAFAASKFAEAKKNYTQSIALQPSCLAYANRAMAELKLGEFQAAEADSTQATALDPGYVKVREHHTTLDLLVYVRVLFSLLDTSCDQRPDSALTIANAQGLHCHVPGSSGTRAIRKSCGAPAHACVSS